MSYDPQDTASTDDPNEISFNKNEVLEILDKNGKWWQARKQDGTVGSESDSAIPMRPPLSRPRHPSRTVELSADHLILCCLGALELLCSA